jgi:iron complex outermembrane receptor protein
MHVRQRTPVIPKAALLTALISSFTLHAIAQQTIPVDAVSASASNQTVVVTGTRARNRTVADSESPIDILSNKDINSTGSNELATVLARLLPSFNFPRPSGADASDAVRPAQLRGLSPDQTLVLINGKRRHSSAVVNVNGSDGRGSAPVDLNAIPLLAIDHIEVLRDGAAAQYGSDAIAGVVNIILKKGATGGEVDFGAGEYSKKDGKQADLKAQSGFSLGDKGWVRLGAEVANQDPTNRAGPDFRNPKEPLYGQITQRYGDPASQPKSLFFNSQLSLSEEVDLYAFGTLSERNTSAAATWRTAFNGGVLRTPIFPDGFLPLENSSSVDRALVFGVRGIDGSGWRWDTSLNLGANTFDLDVDNTVNLALGASSPTHFHAGQLTNEQALLNLDLAREFPVAAFSGPLTVGVGAEARRERYNIEAGDSLSYYGSGSQGFSGFTPANAGSSTRNSASLYANLEAELTQRWSGAVALRGEHYSDFGNTTSEKISSRYVLADGVALRATASTGFRAPSLAQEDYTITTTNFIVINSVNTPIETGTFGVDTNAAKALGAQPLKPEKSTNFSLGLQLEPIKNLTSTIDLYQIDIKNRILYSANMILPASLQAALAAQGNYVGAARYFTNALDTRTLGVDLVTTYRLDLQEKGKLDLTLGYNHNHNLVRNIAANPALLTQNGLTLIDRQTIGRATVGSPKDKLSLGADYTIAKWNLHAVATRYGSFIVEQNNPALDETYSPNWVLDVASSYRLGSWNLTAGIDNLTNRYPDQVTSAGNLNNNGINPYSIWSPYGFNGRFLYAKASYTW